MITNRFLCWGCGAILALVLFPERARAAEAQTGGLNFEAQIVWGTNEANPQPDDPNITLKAASARLKDKLGKVFKWKYYFEVADKRWASTSKFVVAKGNAKKVKLSDKCEIEIQDLGDLNVEVRLFGEGILVSKTKHLIKEEPLVIGGEAKDDTAWFVVVKTPMSPPEPKP